MLKILYFIMLILISLGVVGCSATNGLTQAVWFTPKISDTKVSIPVSEVEHHKMTHFRVGTSFGDISFMAYELEENIYVRANVCPPCGSVGFSLQGDILVCDTCRTNFNARTGEGISGGCVNYPKKNVAYEVVSGNIVMSITDLHEAYEETLNPG